MRKNNLSDRLKKVGLGSEAGRKIDASLELLIAHYLPSAESQDRTVGKANQAYSDKTPAKPRRVAHRAVKALGVAIGKKKSKMTRPCQP